MLAQKKDGKLKTWAQIEKEFAQNRVKVFIDGKQIAGRRRKKRRKSIKC